MIHLFLHEVAHGGAVPAAQHQASEPDVTDAVFREGLYGCATALVVTLQVVPGDLAKQSLLVALVLSNPDSVSVISDDVLHASLVTREPEPGSVLEAVQTGIGAHPQTAVASPQDGVNAYIRGKGILRWTWGHSYPIESK